MNEPEAPKPRRIPKVLRGLLVCLALLAVWKGRAYLTSISVPAYEKARRDEIFRGAVDLFPETSRADARLVRFRHFDIGLLKADHILLARFEGPGPEFVDGLRKLCDHPFAEEDPRLTEYLREESERKGAQKWDRFAGAVLSLPERFQDRRKDFEYCPVSYIPVGSDNHTETVFWLERGGRTAILYGEYYSG